MKNKSQFFFTLVFMKYFHVFFLLLFWFHSPVFSQVKYDYNWLFGRGSSSMFEDGTLINFNNNPSTISI